MEAPPSYLKSVTTHGNRAPNRFDVAGYFFWIAVAGLGSYLGFPMDWLWRTLGAFSNL